LSSIVEPSSLDYATPENRSGGELLGVPRETWGRVLVITALFAAVFWHNLVRLWLKTNPFTGEANWSHSIVVPIIGLYYLFIHREELIKAHARDFIWGSILRPGRLVAAISMIAVGAGIYFLTKNHSGIAISIVKAGGMAIGVLGALGLVLDWSMATVLFGLSLFVYGIYPGKNDYISDLGMVVTLFGIVLLLCGWNVMKIAWFPIAFLVVALPWPGLVYSWVAEPLSILAAKVAAHTLQLTGVDSACIGTKIKIASSDPMQPPRILNVAEACAGMRSLMTFIAVAGAVAFLVARPLWQRIIIVVSAIPIAIFCNVMRISGQGLLDHYVSQEWSESFAHQFVGMVMLAPAFAMILLVGFVLDKLFIEEGDDDDKVVSRAPATLPTRAAPIPAVGSMAAARSPAAAPAVVAAPVVRRPVPAPVSMVSAQPAAVAPRTVPPAPRPVPVAPAAGAARPIQTPPRPVMASTPPRPVTAANPRPRIVPPAPANGQNGRTPPPPVRTVTPASPASAGPRTSVNPGSPRPPEVKPVVRPAPTAPAAKPANAQPKETQ
jgi:exosortase